MATADRSPVPARALAWTARITASTSSSSTPTTTAANPCPRPRRPLGFGSLRIPAQSGVRNSGSTSGICTTTRTSLNAYSSAHRAASYRRAAAIDNRPRCSTVARTSRQTSSRCDPRRRQANAPDRPRRGEVGIPHSFVKGDRFLVKPVRRIDSSQPSLHGDLWRQVEQDLEIRFEASRSPTLALRCTSSRARPRPPH